MSKNKFQKRKRGEEDSSGRSRCWTGVWNNYTLDNYDEVLNCPKFNYVIVGKERCPTTGTPHLQFYCRSENALRFNTLKTMWPSVHWEVAYGDYQSNFDYCSKEGLW